MIQSALNRARATRKDDSGFTLIELLLVIVILGVLAGIVVFSVSGITDKGDTAACKASKSTVATAYEAYVAQSTGAAPAMADVTLGALSPKYLHSVPEKIGASTTTGTTTVAAVEAITCPAN